ncbi:hypothetical protein ACHHYP_10867 [Achlya hypogyna]|uniref:Uncharacterized protein n=1 Tax=Achlya hypogyna TaxID=1202772 RepID=A0A1V9YKE0_ACHHY|nr:hypothetical protein ACHHYP_10867 [Achlya hypogyna]
MQSLQAVHEAETEENRRLHKGFKIATDVFKHSVKDQMYVHTLASHAAHKLRARTEILDMLKYFCFLALFLAFVINSTSSDARFRLGRLITTQILEKEFQIANTSVYKSYLTVDNLDEFYSFLTGPFWFSVFAAGSFDADTTYISGPLYNQPGFFGGSSQILGTIRIGQLRVAACPCEGVVPVENLTQPWCFPEYSSSTESKEPFGLGVTYEASTHESEPVFISITNRAYPGPTFTVELPNQEPRECEHESKHHCSVYAQLEALRTTKFFDTATRAIFVDFSVYNYNADVVTVVRLFVEQTMGGGLLATKNVVSFTPYLTGTTSEQISLGIQVLLYLVVLAQAYSALRHLYIHGLAYYKAGGGGSLANDINIVLFFLVAGLKCLMVLNLPSEYPPDVYINMRTSANYDYLSQSINSLNCFLSILKIFKYLSFLPTFNILTATVSNAISELVGLFILIAILLFGGSLAFTLAFGTSLAHYSVLLYSFYSLMSIFTLKLDVEEIFGANRILGPLFFITFVALIVLVIMHMLIACFENAYMEQKETYMFAKTMKVGSIGHEIVDHLLYHMIFKIPYLGPRVLLPWYQRSFVSSLNRTSDPALVRKSPQLHTAGGPQVVPVTTSAIEEMDFVETKNQAVHRMIAEIEEAHSAVVADIDHILENLTQRKVRHGPEVDILYEQLDALKKLEDEFEGCVAAMTG